MNAGPHAEQLLHLKSSSYMLSPALTPAAQDWQPQSPSPENLPAHVQT